MLILGVVSSARRSVPNAPTIGTATNIGTGRAYNNGAATVTFTAPTFDGGLPITTYTVTSSPGGFTASGASSPLTVTGLASNTAYTFTVKATNAIGQSAASSASNSITATTVPQAPIIGTATGGSSSASVTFTAQATGGSAITGFTATSSPGGITGTGASSPITVSGLTNGTAYTFTVTATNANGTSLASAASNSATPGPVLSAWTLSTAYPAGNPINVTGVGGMANKDSWWGNGYNDNYTSSTGGARWVNTSSTWDTVNTRNDAFAAGMQRTSQNGAMSVGGYNWSGGVNSSARSSYGTSSWGALSPNYPYTTTSVGIARISGGYRYAGGSVNANRTYSANTDSDVFTQRTDFPVTDSGVYAIDTGPNGDGEGLYFPRTNSNVYSIPNHTSSTWTFRATQPVSGSARRDVSTNNSDIVYHPVGVSPWTIYVFSPTTNTFTSVGTAPTTADRFSIAFDRISNRVRGVESQTTSTANRRHWFATLG